MARSGASGGPVPHGREAVAAQVLASVEAGAVPGAVILVGDAERSWEPIVAGVRRLSGPSVTPDTRFDLASLTKVVGCLPLLLRFLEAGELRLDDTVRRFFHNAGWFQAPSLADVTLEDLATHRSGLPAWKPLFATVPDRRTAVANTLQTELSGAAGSYVYSDLGVMVLTAVLERVAGERLDAVLEREVLTPLRMRHTGYGPVAAGVPVAATEDDGLRGGVLEGVVHDENAWIMDGVSGHAGLFGTAEDLLLYGRAWLLREAPFAAGDWLDQAVRDRSQGDGPRRGLLWRLAEPGWAFGQGPSAGAYGHTGFTGTSLCIDPEQGWICVMLTNRVHPDRASGEGVTELRWVVHEAIAEAHAQGSIGVGSAPR